MDKAKYGELTPKLVEYVQKRVLWLIGWYGINEHDTEDIAQQVLAYLHRRLKVKRSEGPIFSPTNYILGLIKKRVRKAIAAIRGDGEQWFRGMESLQEPYFNEHGESIDWLIAVADQYNCEDAQRAARDLEVREIVSRLPRKLRRLCKLLPHLNYGDIAYVLNTSPSQVRRMRARLQKIFLAKSFLNPTQNCGQKFSSKGAVDRGGKPYATPIPTERRSPARPQKLVMASNASRSSSRAPVEVAVANY